MEKTLNYPKMDKKAISLVISTLIIILIVLILVGILWTTIKDIVFGKTEYAKSCFDTFEKATIKTEYTCYNSSSDEFQFSIEIGDIEIDELLVSISKPEGTKTFKIKKENSLIENLRNYPSGNDVKLPGKMWGTTYLYNMSSAGLSGIPNLIKIAPIINGNQCDVSDTYSGIVNCASLA